MKSDWKQYELKDVISLIIDHRGLTPKKLGGNWSAQGYRALSAKNIKMGELINENSIRYVNPEMYKKWMPDEIEYGDILITSEAPFGQIYQWNSNEKIVLSQRLFAIRVKPDFDPVFIYYYLTSTNFQEQLRTKATGTTVTGLRQPELLKCTVNCPPLLKQKEISKALSTLDKKILLNEKINQNIEKQVQLIFQYIFRGKESATLNTIKDVALNITDGVHNTVHDDPNGKYYLLSCKNIKGGHLNISNKERKINKLTFDKLRRRTKLEKGDILVSSVGTVGEICLLNETPTNYEFQRSVAIIKPNLSIVSSEYLFEALISKRSELINAAHGAVQQCLFISDISNFPISIPSTRNLRRFNRIAKPMLDVVSANREENKLLSLLRNNLLLKLISRN